MGCCEIRDKLRDKHAESKGIAFDERDTRLIKSYRDLDLVLAYLETLDHGDYWQLLVAKDDVVVESCDRSIFTSQVPVLMGWTYLQFNVPIMVLEQLILYERSWDSRLEKMELIESREDFQVFKLIQKFPLKNRVFFVKVFRFEKNGTLMFLTVNHLKQVEQEEQLELGWYHFSLIRVKDLGEKVLVSHLFQIDSNYESGPYLNYALGNELFDWLSRIKQRAFEVYKKIC